MVVRLVIWVIEYLILLKVRPSILFGDKNRDTIYPVIREIMRVH